jgi:hypothetical protein
MIIDEGDSAKLVVVDVRFLIVIWSHVFLKDVQLV